jgi:hypothetical protein
MGLTRPRAHQLQETSFKFACRAISTSNVTLSGGAPATVDGVSVTQGDRVLVIGQTNKAQNGIYNVATVGTGSNGTWNRTKDADDANDITAGTQVSVTEGTTYGDTVWKLTTDGTITIGTTDQDWEQASAYGFGTVTVDGTSLVADTVGDTLTVSEGTNISLSGDAGTDTFTIATVGAPTFSGNVTAGNLTTAGALSVGEVISDLIPDADVTRDLGSPTKQWHSVYVGPGSLYINGQKVLEEDSGTIVVGADENQNISLTTTGTGDIEFNPGGSIELKGNVVLAAGKTMSQAGGAASEFSAGVKSDSVTSRTADTNLTLSGAGTGVVNVNDDLTVSQNLTVTGNLTINGATTTVSSTNTTIEDALILLVDGQSGAPTKDAGLVIDRGSSTNVAWIWDESADQFVAITTSDDATTAGDVTITDYTDIRVGSATIDDTLTATGNVTGGNLITGAQVVATGNVTGGNLVTSADVTTVSVNASGTIDATGNITGGNIITSEAVEAATVDTTGEATLASATVSDLTSGRVVLAGTAGALEDSNNLTFNGSTLAVTGAATVSTTLGVTGNVTGGNLLTGGLVNATGNVDGANFNTAGLVSATGNIQGGNIVSDADVTTVSVNASGNVSGGNILSSGAIHTGDNGVVRFYDSDSSHYVEFRAQSTVASNLQFKWPAQDGTSGQVIQTDGAGTLSFATASGGGGGASGFQSSTITTHPAAGGNEDLATGPNDDVAETPFESGAQDAFGVSLGTVYDQMEPIGSTTTIDLGDSEAYVGA